jgi:putative FmdB family regulatory protein
MPLYDFRCPKCDLQFEVSRPISRASEPAPCPVDGTEAQRVFTMPVTYMKGGAQTPPASDSKPDAANWSHHGHSHGPGSHGHSH